MFKLPVCPHCHTVYDYKEVAKNTKEFSCYHCKNKIKVKKFKGHLCLFLLTCIVGTLVDIALINISAFNISTVVPLFIATFICVIIAFLLTPYFTDYDIDKKDLRFEAQSKGIKVENKPEVKWDKVLEKYRKK